MSKDAGLALRNSSEESSSVITSFVRMCCFKKEKSFDRMTLATVYFLRSLREAVPQQIELCLVRCTGALGAGVAIPEHKHVLVVAQDGARGPIE